MVNALKLPTLNWQGNKLIKRLTLVIEDGRIVQVFYPVFPPDKSAQEVLDWLATKPGRQALSSQAENDMAGTLQDR